MDYEHLTILTFTLAYCASIAVGIHLLKSLSGLFRPGVLPQCSLNNTSSHHVCLYLEICGTIKPLQWFSLRCHCEYTRP